MKKLIYRTGTLLSIAAIFLLSFSLTAQEISKDFHKEFKAGSSTTLDINNKYGDVVIENWAKDEVVIDVKVVVSHSDKSKAERLMSYIDVQFSDGDNLIGAKTVIEDKFTFSGWGMGSRRFSIDYTVKMPAGMNLNLKNSYGDTEIGELNGIVNIIIRYGDLTLKKLTRGNEKPLNRISVSYGEASIDEVGWLDLNLNYCRGMEIEKSQALLLNSNYSTLNIGVTSSVVGETKYGGLEIETIKNLVLQSGYTAVNINELSNKLDFRGHYRSLSVDRIPSGFESIDIDTDYMDVDLGIDVKADYTLDARSSYGDIEFDSENFNREKRIVSNNSTTLTGIVGKNATPASTVKIVTSYGQVKLY